MPWRPYEFRGQTVYVRVLPEGKPIVRRGLVEFRYKVGPGKSYRSTRDNFEEPTSDELISDEKMSGRSQMKGPRETPLEPADAETIVIYTDGACSGNPGPAGAGVFVQWPDRELEIAEYLGEATNNHAELTGILRALEALDPEKDAPRRIHLYTDSAWSLGVLIGGWKAKTNLRLIDKIQKVREPFTKLEMLKIKGHAGHAGNELADELATKAVRREDTTRRERPRRG